MPSRLRGRTGRGLTALVAGIAASAALTFSAIGGPSAAAGSASPVSVMLMIPLSGTIIQLPDIEQSVTAGIDGINAHGGLDGHHVNLVVCDDGYNAALTTACATKAVQDHVLAVLSAFTAYGSLVYPILQGAGIPSIGDFPASNADLINPLSWPALGDADSIYAGEGESVVKAGCKKVGILSLDAPADTPYINYARAGIQQLGGTLEQPTLVPTSASDMAPYVTQAESKPIGCLIFNLLPSNTVAVVNAAAGTGKSVTLSSIEIEVAQALPQLGKKANGMVIDTPILAATLNPPTSAPAMLRLYASEMKKYQPGKAADSFSLQGWEAVGMLAQAAKGLTTLTPKTLVASLNKLNWNPGISGRANWGAPAPIPALPRLRNTYQWLAKVENGNVVLTSNKPINVAAALRRVPASELK